LRNRIPFLISTIAAWRFWLGNRVIPSVVERRERSPDPEGGEEDVEAGEETPLLRELDEETGQSEEVLSSDLAVN
jgi:hypothetical protein